MGRAGDVVVITRVSASVAATPARVRAGCRNTRLLGITQSQGDRWTALRDAGPAPAWIIRLVSSFCISGSSAPHRAALTGNDAWISLCCLWSGPAPWWCWCPPSTRRPIIIHPLVVISRRLSYFFIFHPYQHRISQVQKVCISNLDLKHRPSPLSVRKIRAETATDLILKMMGSRGSIYIQQAGC